MRSKVHIAGHPVHPMLIPLPVAFFIGTLAADIVARATGSYHWYFTGYVLTIAGFVCGLLAALPGLVDYLKVIPSRTQAKKHATLHMGLNVIVVALYVASWLVKNATGAPPSGAALTLEIIGCALLVYSGWLGWTLVYQHRIGIDEPTGETSTSGQRRAG